jgi:ABC-2 type transport system ATP-binding protein
MNKSAHISTIDLTKAYGNFIALRQLSLEVQQGEIFGLLGPNGSGKTTTIRVLLGLLRPTEGKATVAGFDCWRQSFQVRRLVSYLPGELRMYGSMSGLSLLRFLCDLREDNGLDRAVAIAERMMKLNLKKKVRAYSTGMKQKLALALAFADPVDILILDEPTSSLDPSARADVLNMVKEARSHGQTVIFSGHVLSEVEAVADRVAILRRGRVMHIENMHERRNLRMLLIRFAHEPPAEYPGELEVTERERKGKTCLLEHRGAIGPLLHWLDGSAVEDIAIGTEDLLSLYNRFHGPDVVDDEEDLPS